MEAGECGRTRGTCFVARHLEVVAVAELLWISWCVLGGADFFSVFFFLRTHTTCCKYQATSCLIYLSTSNEARPRERIDRGRFLPLGTKASSYRGAYRVPLFNLSVYVCVTLNSSFSLIARAVRGRFPHTRHLWKRVSMG